jgi:hypothetical protein
MFRASPFHLLPRIHLIRQRVPSPATRVAHLPAAARVSRPKEIGLPLVAMNAIAVLVGVAVRQSRRGHVWPAIWMVRSCAAARELELERDTPGLRLGCTPNVGVCSAARHRQAGPTVGRQ